MPDLSDAEFDAAIAARTGAQQVSEQPAPEQSATPDLVKLDLGQPTNSTGLSATALQDSQSRLNTVSTAQLPAATPSQETVNARMGKRPGVEFDTKDGVGFGARFFEQFTLNQAQQAWVLKHQPNVTDVRFNSYNEPIVTIKDPTTGIEKDVLANPHGLDVGDFAYVLANAPLLLGGGLGAAGIKATPPVIGEALSTASKVARWFLSSKSVLPTAVRGAVAAEVLQAGKELSMQGLMGALGGLPREGEPGHLTPGQTVADVVKTHGENVIPDIIYGEALGAVGKGISAVVSPLAKTAMGPLQVNAKAAFSLLKAAADKEGLPFVNETTPGEATGFAPMLRLEAANAKLPGSTGVFHEFTTAKINNDATSQRILYGTDPTAIPPADLVGADTLAAISGKLRPLDTMLDRETQGVLDAANRAIKQDASAAAGVIPENVSVSAVGKQLIDGAQARYEAFQKQSTALYNLVKQDPLIAGQGRNIDATPLAKDAQAILDSIPAVEKQVEQPTGLLDARGNPLTISETQTQPLNSFVESDAIKRLRDLAAATDGKVSLRDLMEARTDIGDSISRGSVLGGVPERRLSDIYGALTGRIKQGLTELDDSGRLLKDWEAANQHHADQIAKFKDTEILSIFKGAERPGAQSPYDVVNRAMTDPGKWDAYRDFYGAGSEEFKSLKGAYANKIMGRVIGSDTINLRGFADRLDAAYNSHPNILLDTFGDKLVGLKKLGEVGDAVLKGNVDTNEMAALLAKGSVVQADLKRLAATQAARESVYRSGYFKRMAAGDFSQNPSQFVDNFIFSGAAEPADVRNVVSLLADQPETLKALQQRALFKLISESEVSPRVGESYMASTGLKKFLNDQPGNMIATRLEALLGGETMALLRAVHDLRAPGDVKSREFASAGSMGATTMIRNLEQAPTLQLIAGVAKNFAIASLYKSGVTRAYLANAALAKDTKAQAALLNVLIGSAPILTDLTRTFPGQSARVTSVQIKSVLDQAARGQIGAGNDISDAAFEAAVKARTK